MNNPVFTKFQTTLHALLQTIESSVKLSPHKKEKLYERMYEQIRNITEAVLVVHMPEEKLNELTDHPDALNLSSYADLIIATVRDPKTASGLEAALTGLVEDISQAITPKL